MVWGDRVYSCSTEFVGWMGETIANLEMVNILLMLRVWISDLHTKVINIHCDNQSVVHTLNSGRGRDPFLLALSRNIWRLAAQNDIEINFFHVSGKVNTTADLLSRWESTANASQRLWDLIPQPKWTTVYVNNAFIDYTI